MFVAIRVFLMDVIAVRERSFAVFSSQLILQVARYPPGALGLDAPINGMPIPEFRLFAETYRQACEDALAGAN